MAEISTNLSQIVAQAGQGFFLARLDQVGTVSLYTYETASVGVEARLQEAARAVGLSTKFRVKKVAPSRIGKARSLEKLASSVTPGETIFDPTEVFSRSSALIEAARAVRLAAGNRVRQVLFDSWRRTLVIVMNDAAFRSKGDAFRQETAETVDMIAKAVAEWRRVTYPPFDVTVRIGFDPPETARLIAVDEASVDRRLLRKVGLRLSRWSKLAGVASLLGFGAATTAMAADMVKTPAEPALPAGTKLPAVSGPNVQIMTFGGGDNDSLNHDENGFGGAAVKVTLPLGSSFGFQADGGLTSNDYVGVGGHLFWRDPNQALLGAFASFEDQDGTQMTRFGAEAELYLSSVTVGGRLGYQDGDVDNGVFGRLDVSFYATPSFALRVGAEADPDRSVGRVGFEWQPAPESMAGLSIYADSQFSEDGLDRVMAGLKYHFGEAGVSLMDRERREDPALSILNVIRQEKDYGGGPI